MNDDRDLADKGERPLGRAARLARLAAIGAIMLGVTGAFGYVGGWFSPR